MFLHGFIFSILSIAAVVFLAQAAILIAEILPDLGKEMITKTIYVDDEKFEVFIADTYSHRAQGLGGLASLSTYDGMLFIFEKDGRYQFWMKDMYFPIDIIWVAANGTVAHVTQSVSPESYPQSFTPDTFVRYVLEVPAGFSDEHGVHAGQSSVTF